MTTINVKLKSGKVVPMTHPDDWSQEQVEQAIHESFPDETTDNESNIPPIPGSESQIEPIPKKVPVIGQVGEEQQPIVSAKKETTGLKGLAEDAMDLLRETMKGGIGFVQRVPENIKEQARAYSEHPLDTGLHNAGQIIAGLAEGGKGLYNLQHGLLKELGKKELIPKWLEKYNEAAPLSHVPEDTGIEKALGLQPTRKSDELIRALPAIIGGVGSVVKGVTKGVTKLTSPSKETLFKRKLEDRLNEAKKEYGLSKEQTEAFGNKLRTDYAKIHKEDIGELTPTGQEVSISKKEGQIEKAYPSANIPEKTIGKIPVSPDTQKILSHFDKFEDEAKQSLSNVLEAKEGLSRKGGEKVKTSMDNLHKETSNLYNEMRDSYETSGIKIDNSKKVKEVREELNQLNASDNLAPGYGSGTPEQAALELEIKALESETVPAADVYRMKRTLDHLSSKADKAKYETKGNEIEFNRLNDLSKRYEQMSDKLAETLESVGDPDHQAKMKKANQGWRTWKDLSERNSIGKHVLKHTKIPPNTMDKLTGTEPGNVFLNTLVHGDKDLKIPGDPELRKYILGQSFVEKKTGKVHHEALIEPVADTKKYLDSLPEVGRAVKNLEMVFRKVKEGKALAPQLNKAHDKLTTAMKNEAKLQQTRQESNKKIAKFDEQIKFKKDAIPKIQARIKIDEAKGLNVTKLEDELHQYQRDVEDSQKAKKLLQKGLELVGITSIGHKLGL